MTAETLRALLIAPPFTWEAVMQADNQALSIEKYTCLHSR
jgi:hypothetical protein